MKFYKNGYICSECGKKDRAELREAIISLYKRKIK
jgi:hypothetical protein